MTVCRDEIQLGHPTHNSLNKDWMLLNMNRANMPIRDTATSMIGASPFSLTLLCGTYVPLRPECCGGEEDLSCIEGEQHGVVGGENVAPPREGFTAQGKGVLRKRGGGKRGGRRGGRGGGRRGGRGGGRGGRGGGGEEGRRGGRRGGWRKGEEGGRGGEEGGEERRERRGGKGRRGGGRREERGEEQGQ